MLNGGKNQSKEIPLTPNQIAKTAYSIQHILQNGIENFIEKGCIEACKQLWELNIFTFESSNNTNYPCAWIDLLDLSPENEQVFAELQAQGKAGRNPWTHNNCLIAPVGADAEPEFLKNISQFHMQDVPKQVYQSGKEFLDNYQRRGGEAHILEDGTLSFDINPNRAHLTLEEALEQTNNSHLYDQERNRLFIDEYSYQQYQRYVQYLNQKNR